MTRRWNFLLDTYLAICGLIVIMALSRTVAPRITQGTYRIGDKPVERLHMPLRFASPGGTIYVQLTMHAPRESIPPLRLTVDDCLEELRVDGVAPSGVPLPFCGGAKETLDLSPFLHRGDNEVSLVVKDTGGLAVLDISSRLGSFMSTLTILLTLALLAWYGRSVSVFAGSNAARFGVIVLAAGGALLRILYALHTPVAVRSHEWDRHMQYIRFVAKEWRIPAFDAGWEFYQPPLYYILTGAWLRVGQFLGRAESAIVLDLQKGSILLSLATLAAITWMAFLIFAEDKRHELRLPFLAMAVTLPGLVYFSSVINNDALLTALSFAWLALLLRWWHTPSLQNWLFAALVLSLAILSKLSALPLVAIAVLSALLRPGEAMGRRIGWVASLLTVLVVCTGWYGVLRMREHGPEIVPNIAGLSPRLQVERSARPLVTFNPVAVLRHPFNDPLNPAARNGQLWEYLLRSAYFGETTFHASYRRFGFVILLFALLSLPLTAWGMWRSLRSSAARDLPLLLTVGVLLLAIAVLRIRYPFATSQDFRYIPLLAVPAAYFAVRGAASIRSAALRRAALSVLWGLSASSAAFVLHLAWKS